MPTMQAISVKFTEAMRECTDATNVYDMFMSQMAGFRKSSENGKELRDKIVRFFQDRFPHMTVFGSVYQPLAGFNNHKTNAATDTNIMIT